MKSILKRSSELCNRIIVIKLPSIVIDNDDLLANFAANVHLLSSCGAKFFIVHDYIDIINNSLQYLGFDENIINSVNGADRRSAQIVEMIISGYINKMIVSKLCDLGCNAVGISGKDANLIRVQKAKLLHRHSTDSDVINLGFVGEPGIVNTEILLNFEENDIIPVISPISSDMSGRTHLLEANMTASIISSAIDADHLILLSEQKLLGNSSLKFDDEIALRNILHSLKTDSKAIEIIKSAIYAIQNSTRLVHFSTINSKDTLLTTLFS